jgi:hypothetical protein
MRNTANQTSQYGFASARGAVQLRIAQRAIVLNWIFWNKLVYSSLESKQIMVLLEENNQ